ncbi:TPA: hypothetical protein ACH3X1_008505 [Trebouxia sp. C0004]
MTQYAHTAQQTMQEKHVVSAGGSRPASPAPPASAVSCQLAPVQGEPCASPQVPSSVGTNGDGLESSKHSGANDAVVISSMTANARQSGKGAIVAADAKQPLLAESQPGSSEQAKSAATSTAVRLHIDAAQSQHTKPPPSSATNKAVKRAAGPAECQPIACTLLVTSSNITADSHVPPATTPQDVHLSGPLSGSVPPPLMPALLAIPAAKSTTPTATSIGDTHVQAPDCSRQQVQQQRQQPSGMPVQESGSPDQALCPVVDTGKSETGRANRSPVSAVDDMSELELDVDTTTGTPVCTTVTHDRAVTASWSRPSAVKRPSCDDVSALVLCPDASAKKQKITHATDHPGAGFSSTTLSTAEHAMPYASDLAQLPAAAAAAAASSPATVSAAVSAAACTHVLQLSRSGLQASHLPDTACVSGRLHSSTAKLSLPPASTSIAAHISPLPISLSLERGLHAASKPSTTQHPKQSPFTLFSSSVVTLKQGSISSNAAKPGPDDILMPSYCTGRAFPAYNPVTQELPSDSNQHIIPGSEDAGLAKPVQRPARAAGADHDYPVAYKEHAVVAKAERGVQQVTEDQAHQMRSSCQPAVQLLFDDDTSSENGRHSSRSSGNDGYTMLAQQQQKPKADTPAGFAKHAVASDLGAIFSSFTAFEEMSGGEEEDDEPQAGTRTPT